MRNRQPKGYRNSIKIRRVKWEINPIPERKNLSPTLHYKCEVSRSRQSLIYKKKIRKINPIIYRPTNCINDYCKLF